MNYGKELSALPKLFKEGIQVEQHTDRESGIRSARIHAYIPAARIIAEPTADALYP
jgi:hypothetical protein